MGGNALWLGRLSLVCVTDSVVYEPTGSMAREREMSTLPKLHSEYYGIFTFYPASYGLWLCSQPCYHSTELQVLRHYIFTKRVWWCQVTNQIFKDDCQRVVCVNNVVQRHYVGVLQIPQQRNCKQHTMLTRHFDLLRTVIWNIKSSTTTVYYITWSVNYITYTKTSLVIHQTMSKQTESQNNQAWSL